METELRRRRIDLMTLGSGVIAFGVWSVVKSILYLMVMPSDFSSLEIDPELRGIAVALGYAFVILLIVLTQSLRLYVGLAARAEGRGRKKGPAYIVIVVLILAFDTAVWLILLGDFWSGKLSNQSRLDYVVSTAVDLTSMATLVDLLYTALRVRKLSRELEG